MEKLKNLQTLSSSPDIIALETAIKYEIKHFPIKRAFDILFSLTCLIIGFPLFLIIGILVYLSSPGQIIYSHERMGRGGKPFKCYKFRTMNQDADQYLQDILSVNPLLRLQWESSFKLKQDPRVTPIGAFLRKTSLDELPQFWNVLKGDLSIVGPRPVVHKELKKYYGVKAYKILSIRPGLTGPWQVSGRNNIDSYKKRVSLDEYYVDNQSFLMDLKLIAKTIPVMLFSKGAY
jgi:undecaprenyl-phosphate galactose phosphotransferase